MVVIILLLTSLALRDGVVCEARQVKLWEKERKEGAQFSRHEDSHKDQQA